MTVEKSFTEERIADFTALSRKFGLKITHQRREIFSELISCTTHPDAETLYQRLRARIPELSPDTVYRNLRTMETHGLVRKVCVVGRRARYDGNVAPHHHLVCTLCGDVSDYFGSDDNFQVPDEVHARMERIDCVHIEFKGVCRQCARDGCLPDTV